MVIYHSCSDCNAGGNNPSECGTYDGGQCKNSNGNGNAQCNGCSTYGGAPGSYYAGGCTSGSCKNPLPGWLIAVIVISVVIGCVLLGLSIWWCVRMGRKKRMKMEELQAQQQQATVISNTYTVPSSSGTAWVGGPARVQHCQPLSSDCPPPGICCTRVWSSGISNSRVCCSRLCCCPRVCAVGLCSILTV